MHAMTLCLLNAKINAVQPAAWPDCIEPVHRDTLRTRTGLRDRYNTLIGVSANLTQQQLQDALVLCHAQNDLPNILDGNTFCQTTSGLPDNFVDALKSFYKFGFSLLSSIGLRDTHYQAIYDHMKNKICPFCGVEPFEAPIEPRHDLDHFLAVSLYPFAGANLKNLVPMGDRCNSAHKHAADILFCNQGNRRRVFDPYGQNVALVSLSNSRFFSDDEDTIEPRWDIDLGGTAESETWDQVWNIKRRYAESHLTPEYSSWLAAFGRWCKRLGLDLSIGDTAQAALEDYSSDLSLEGFADKAYLKKAFFDFIRGLLLNPIQSDRIQSFLIDTVEFA